MRGRVLGKRALDLLEHCLALGAADLVDLGQHHLEGHRRAVEQRQDFVIDLLHAVARVDQHEGAAQVHPAREIGLEQILPLLHHRHRRLGKAIARKVDEIGPAGGGEEVDLLRAPGRVRGAGKVLAVRQRVDERGFAHVRAAGKADLDPVGGRHPRHRDDALQEVDGGGKQQPALLAGEIVGLGGEGELHLHQRISTVSPRAISPPRVTVA
ncbi:hypothetical protein SDC9_21396 [bioreactor metagenome]|uniref:Uncharacterized protein n=1 Tax=bioreactor metagenome TaxID=1076179 RepID=A0A644U9F8_9ZZZZ